MIRFAAFVIFFALAFALVSQADGPTSGEPPVEPPKDAWAAARAEAAKDRKTQWAEGGDAAGMPTGPVSFERGAGGHFYADANVTGTSVRFLVDTGATGVALTEEDARRIGLSFHSGEYGVVGTQVSGVVRGKYVTLESVRVGSKEVRDVKAVIIEGGTMNLLGQSFLTRAGKVEMDGSRMTLR